MVSQPSYPAEAACGLTSLVGTGRESHPIGFVTSSPLRAQEVVSPATWRNVTKTFGELTRVFPSAHRYHRRADLSPLLSIVSHVDSGTRVWPCRRNSSGRLRTIIRLEVEWRVLVSSVFGGGTRGRHSEPARRGWRDRGRGSVPSRVRFDIGPRSLGAAGPMEVLLTCG